MAFAKPRRPERIYVKVNSDFDSTGFMQPRSITWKDGRVTFLWLYHDMGLRAIWLSYSRLIH